MTTMLSNCLALGVVPSILSGLGPVGSHVRELFLAGRHNEIVGLSVDPSGFSDAVDFHRAYSAISLLKKYPCLETGINTSQIAIKKFLESEDRCRVVNERFAHLGTLSFLDRSILERARSEVHRVLRGFSWDMTLPYLSHGPGATFGTKRDRGHPWYKFGDKQPTVTGECLTLTEAFSRAFPLILREWEANGVHPKVVLGSKIATVPKDARSDRVIAIEPLLNMFFQKGIGGLMRSRLKQSGCDLNDQSINQLLAKGASITDRKATIDLSSASDTISRSLVEFLLPSDWLLALKTCRSTQSLLPDGKFLFLQKFSSMGNGYTFELESLIFFGLTRAVCYSMGEAASDVSVYGDDIITPSATVDRLRAIFDICGFSMNVEKSFSSGPFRESCGKHFFRGRDVTPFYLKKKVKSIEEQFWLLNSIRRLSHRLLGAEWGCDANLYEAWQKCYAQIDNRYRGYSVPEGYGDVGILRDFDEVTPRPRVAKHWVEGYEVKVIKRVYKKFRAFDYPALLWRLSVLDRRSASSASSGDDVVDIPLRRYDLKAVKLLVKQWPSTGPWVGSSL